MVSQPGRSAGGGRAPLVRYAEDVTGARIAYAMAGGGTPAVLAIAGWMSHLTVDWEHAEIGTFYAALAARRRLIRYDRPGVGLADRVVGDYSLDAAIDQAVRVMDACGVERCAVFGRTFSGPVAIALAARHPERVSHLVLFGTASRIVAGPGHPDGVPFRLADAVERLVLAEWGLGSETLTSLMVPEVSHETRARYAEYQRLCAAPEVAASMVASLHDLDVCHLLQEVRVPTLVLHRQDDRIVSAACARRLAAGIPGARLAVLEGSANAPYFGDSEDVAARITAFLNPQTALLSPRELEVLGALEQGLSNQAIADALCISRSTAARHVANIFIKLDVGSRSGAVAAARGFGLLRS